MKVQSTKKRRIPYKFFHTKKKNITTLQSSDIKKRNIVLGGCIGKCK